MSNYFNYRAGLSSVGQYQMSGIPFVTASFTVPTHAALGVGALEFEFPQVTRFFTIINTNTGANSPLRVGFSALGTTGSEGGGTDNYFTLDNGESYTGEFKVARVYLLGSSAATSASVIAGLTGIQTGSLQENWSGSAGVG